MATLADELDAFLAEGPDPEPTDLEGADALEQADRWCRGLRRLAREEAEARHFYDVEKARLDEWLADRTAGIPEKRAQLEALIESFSRAWKQRHHHAPPRLPNGSVTLTGPRGSVVVENEEAFVDWAEGTDRLTLLKIEPKPLKDSIKTALKQGPVIRENDNERVYALVTPEGERAPGVELRVPKADSFKLTIQ